MKRVALYMLCTFSEEKLSENDERIYSVLRTPSKLTGKILYTRGVSCYAGCAHPFYNGSQCADKIQLWQSSSGKDF